MSVINFLGDAWCDVDEGRDTGTPAAWAGVCARAALEDPSTRDAFIEALGGAAQFVR